MDDFKNQLEIFEAFLTQEEVELQEFIRPAIKTMGKAMRGAGRTIMGKTAKGTAMKKPGTLGKRMSSAGRGMKKGLSKAGTQFRTGLSKSIAPAAKTTKGATLKRTVS